MRTVACFEHKGRKVDIFKYAQLRPRGGAYLYRVRLDGAELPVDWPNAAELELAIRKLIDES